MNFRHTRDDDEAGQNLLLKRLMRKSKQRDWAIGMLAGMIMVGLLVIVLSRAF